MTMSDGDANHRRAGDVDDSGITHRRNLDVLAYRMGIVESAIEGLGIKLDTVINKYPTNDTLKLILDPIRDDLKELKQKREEEAQEKVRTTQQVKLLAVGAVLGPVGTFFMTIFLTNSLGLNK